MYLIAKCYLSKLNLSFKSYFNKNKNYITVQTYKNTKKRVREDEKKSKPYMSKILFKI